jgi:membrane-associated phospholipid phosphatase
MPYSYPVFVALYAASIVVGLVLGLLVTVGWKDLDWRKALASARFNALYVVLVVGLPIIALAENLIGNPEEATKEIVYTNWIFSMGGDAVRLIQDRLDYQVVADFFIVVYVWVFSYIVYFTPLLVLAKGDDATFRRYAIAIMFNFAVLLPFYVFFPVTVTGFYAESGVTPLLYIDTNWGRMVTGVDPLNNDFPSGHVSLVLTPLLVLGSAREDYRVYYRFLVAACIGIVFAVLYLGVHWLADVFGGFALGIGAYLISGNERVQMTVDRYFRAATVRLLGEEKG